MVNTLVPYLALWTLLVLTIQRGANYGITLALAIPAGGLPVRRGVGDIWTMTVAEYEAATPWKRLNNRLYRHPLVMFGLGRCSASFCSSASRSSGPRSSMSSES